MPEKTRIQEALSHPAEHVEQVEERPEDEDLRDGGFMVGEGRVGWVVPRDKGVVGLRYQVSGGS